jgi:hypothetical protein
MKTKKQDPMDMEPTHEELAPFTPKTNAMMEAGRAEMMRRDPSTYGNRAWFSKHKEASANRLVEVTNELFPDFDKIAADEIIHAHLDVYFQRKVAAGDIVPLPDGKYMDAKKFFALSYDEQQKRLHPD